MQFNMTILFFVLFLGMALQVLMGFLQVKSYKNAMNSYRGTGVVGLGHTKAYWGRMGQIVVLSYKPDIDQVVGCKVMRGMSIFAKFKEVHDYDGMSFDEIREVALAQDAKEFRRYRKKHPYNEEEYSKRKGALIQAVEAVAGRIERDLDEEYKAKAPQTLSLHDQALQKRNKRIENPA